MVVGIDLLSLSAAGWQRLDDHCGGDISMGKGRGGERREGCGLRVGPLEVLYPGEIKQYSKQV